MIPLNPYAQLTDELHRRNLSERLPGPAQTNNRAELMGIIRALETCPFGGDLAVEVRTDSKYCIDCEYGERGESRT